MTTRFVGGSTAGPSRRRASVLWFVIAVMLVLSGACLVVIPTTTKMPALVFLVFTAMTTSLSIVGALIVARQPRNAVGWILWVAGVTTFVSDITSVYANFAVTPDGATLPGATFVAWLAPIGFFPSFIAILIFVPLLFPDGRYLSRRWRWVGAFGAAVVGLVLAGIMFTPGPLEEYPTIVNPVGLAPIAGLQPLLLAASTWGFVIAAPLAIASAFVRFRRGSALERTQLRWFGAAAGLTVAVLVVSFAPGAQGDAAALAWLGGIIGLTLIPVAIGVAILRYRLYEIDRLISRTIGWAMVTGVLVGVFAALVVALETVFAPITKENTLAVAASTLVAFALFQPLRRRVQRAVDRRFDRARYDGQRTVDVFAEGLRSEVDLATLRTSLATTADEAVRPVSAAVWLAKTMR